MVLPSRYPNLLVNGSSGIAVGMATNIPPHNLGETISAVIAMIENPEIEVEDLMDVITSYSIHYTKLYDDTIKINITIEIITLFFIQSL